MAEKLERLAHPSSRLEEPGVLSPRGISRTNITVIISGVALIAAAAGAGVLGWKWSTGEQQKILNEASQLQPDARANAIIEEMNKNPDSHPRLKSELKKLHDDLTYVPPSGALGQYEEFAFSAVALRVAAPALERRKLAAEKNQAEAAVQDHFAAVRNHNQDVAKKFQETRSELKKADIAVGVVTPSLVESLSRAANFSVTANPSPLSVPSVAPHPGSMPIGTLQTAANDPYKNDSNIGRSRDDIASKPGDDPWKNRSNLGKE